jgi:DNA-directed RNA polymerase beta subunit
MSKMVEILKLMKGGSSKPVVADDDEFDSYTPVGLDGILASTEKLLAVNRGLDDPDERDAMPNDRVHTTDMLLGERIKMDTAGKRRQLMWHAARHRSLKGLHPFVFDSYGRDMLIGNPLSQPLEEINPLQILTQSRRMTKMGPGGIGDSNAVTESMRAVHASQFGFLSPTEGPESGNAGIDVRLARGVKVGSDRRLYQRFRNTHTGKIHWMSPEDMVGATLKLPD